MMNKHTHGEWRIRNNSVGGPFVSSDSGTIADVRTRGGIHVGGPQHPETMANARLIAAAPDLLEAAQLCRTWMYEYASNTDDNAFEKLCAAIAKATGDQS